jgi:hypothetical protein
MIVITVIWDGAKTSVLSPILHNVLSPFTTVILDSISVNISLYLENARGLVEQMRYVVGASPETPIVGGSSSGQGAAEHPRQPLPLIITSLDTYIGRLSELQYFTHNCYTWSLERLVTATQDCISAASIFGDLLYIER